MIDIDHETKYAYSENLSLPGEEAVLQEPNMDQIEGKLTTPNMTGIFNRFSLIISPLLPSLQFISMLIKSNSNGKSNFRIHYKHPFLF